MADATATTQSKAATPTSGSFLVRVGGFLAGWAAVHLGIVTALTLDITPDMWIAPVALFALILVAVALLLRSFREDAHPGVFHRLFVVRPFWYVQMGLPFLSVAGGTGWLIGLPFGQGLAWARFALAATATILVAAYLAGFVGSKWLVVKRLTFEYPDLPPAFDGLRLAQLSDLHVGPHSSRRFLRRVVRAVEREQPDIIAHTGDQVDDYHEDAPRFTAAFASLVAPAGTFAIAGNHDVYAGWSEVRTEMERSGMRVLVNDAVPIRRGSDEIWIAGTGDPAALSTFGQPAPEAAPDIARTYEKVPAGAFTIVLAHNPALWPHLLPREPHLTLSGHTHHGQLSIPALKWSLASPFLKLAMGSYESGRSRLYIHPGTNYWGLPFRLGAWPEVTLITLRRAPPAEGNA